MTEAEINKKLFYPNMLTSQFCKKNVLKVLHTENLNREDYYWYSLL